MAPLPRMGLGTGSRFFDPSAGTGDNRLETSSLGGSRICCCRTWERERERERMREREREREWKRESPLHRDPLEDFHKEGNRCYYPVSSGTFFLRSHLSIWELLPTREDPAASISHFCDHISNVSGTPDHSINFPCGVPKINVLATLGNTCFSGLPDITGYLDKPKGLFVATKGTKNCTLNTAPKPGKLHYPSLITSARRARCGGRGRQWPVTQWGRDRVGVRGRELGWPSLWDQGMEREDMYRAVAFFAVCLALMLSAGIGKCIHRHSKQ